MISYEGGDGHNKKEAIIIKGASNEPEGVSAEYAWIADLYGERSVDWEREEQIYFENYVVGETL